MLNGGKNPINSLNTCLCQSQKGGPNAVASSSGESFLSDLFPINRNEGCTKHGNQAERQGEEWHLRRDHCWGRLIPGWDLDIHKHISNMSENVSQSHGGQLCVLDIATPDMHLMSCCWTSKVDMTEFALLPAKRAGAA